MTVDPQTLQIGDRVVPTGRYLYADLVCTVVAIQRLRFRAEVKWPDGHRRWIPTRELRRA
jgi:hypothetical protein